MQSHVYLVLIREAEEDLKQTMGRGAAMGYGADWSDAAIRQGMPAARKAGRGKEQNLPQNRTSGVWGAGQGAGGTALLRP